MCMLCAYCSGAHVHLRKQDEAHARSGDTQFMHLQLARHEGLHLHAEVVAVGHLGRLDLQPHLHRLEVLDRLRVKRGQ